MTAERYYDDEGNEIFYRDENGKIISKSKHYVLQRKLKRRERLGKNRTKLERLRYEAQILETQVEKTAYREGDTGRRSRNIEDVREINISKVKSAHVPTLYNNDLCEKAYGFALLGMDNRAIATEFHVDGITFDKWIKEYVNLKDALSRGRAGAGTAIVKSAFNLATGQVKSTKTTKEYDKKGKLTKTTVTEEVLPPSAPMLSRWLESRYPELWAKKTDVNVNVSFDKILELANAKAETIIDAEFTEGKSDNED